MSKGNSGLLTKHQSKNLYTSTGVIGKTNGFEVLTEVVIRVNNSNVNPDHTIRVTGRIANDTKFYDIGTVTGDVSEIFHIASWDYIKFECTKYSCLGPQCTLITSAYFSDGMFMVNAINDMSDKVSAAIFDMHSEVCDIKKSINTLHRQIELITDHEEDEVK